MLELDFEPFTASFPRPIGGVVVDEEKKGRGWGRKRGIFVFSQVILLIDDVAMIKSEEGRNFKWLNFARVICHD